jgi:aminoglycoside 3-N-acetyltransferase I
VPLDYRWLAPGDEEVVRELSVRSAELGDGAAEPRYSPLDSGAAAAFLVHEQNHVLVAFDGKRPVGMLLAYELERRHGDPRMLFIYELGVDAGYRRRGIARELLRRARALARERGINEGFVLTEESNEAAMALYASAGGVRPSEDEAMFDFDFGSENG